MDAAIDVLAEGGYSAASLAAIAGRIGVSKGVISYHFAGKDDLLREVVSSVLAKAGEYMSPRIEAAAPGVQALRAYLRSNLEFIDAHRREILAVIEVVNGTPASPDAPAPYGPGHRDAVTALTGLLQAGQQSGSLRSFDARYVAVALRASVDALSELLRENPEMDVGAYGAELERLFEQGVRA